VNCGDGLPKQEEANGSDTFAPARHSASLRFVTSGMSGLQRDQREPTSKSINQPTTQMPRLPTNQRRGSQSRGSRITSHDAHRQDSLKGERNGQPASWDARVEPRSTWGSK
jgi:hypothetical protein